MQFFELEISRIKRALNTGLLPGLQSQLKMMPVTRTIEKAYLHDMRGSTTKTNNPKKSAVLLLLYPKNGVAHIIMMVRAIDKSVHSGQISFPGGKFENSDSSLVYTALREAKEEIGIVPNDVEIIGELSSIYIPPSNFDVYPFVGVSKSTPVFSPNNEVNKLLEIKLSDLQNPTIKGYEKIKHRLGNDFIVPCYHINQEVVWGASAMILSEFLDLNLQQANS